MSYFLTRLGDLLGPTRHDPDVRNIVALVACIALYGLFLTRDQGGFSSGRARRPTGRCPDSILRNARASR